MRASREIREFGAMHAQKQTTGQRFCAVRASSGDFEAKASVWS
jgi:hypothetical protein